MSSFDRTPCVCVAFLYLSFKNLKQEVCVTGGRDEQVRVKYFLQVELASQVLNKSLAYFSLGQCLIPKVHPSRTYAMMRSISRIWDISQSSRELLPTRAA